MEPLIALVVVTSGVLVVGRLWVPRLRPLPVGLRGGIAAMFLLTGIAHFVGMREELIAMVPDALPAPGLLVTVTGVLELAGALAMLYRPLAHWAAAGLSTLLVVMFPANVNLALNGTDLPWDDTLLPRTLMQVVFLAATVTVAVHGFRARAGRATTADPVPAGR
ncbi:hypothetical protein DI005_37485 [Prauserella sp. PE36]|uniref:DoxX family protein n=1 Tax=Prauserella sp. PE36 TaxID=1504709 RepID=UPI000D9E7F7B|nr:hypothetical protein [Prauserella sp. PE36]PXY37047.1 hypothetical protein BAY59_00165 [Prauserella coralliicola]RBM10286.1 hypothetical protein DI005_37485 [Prauserella sp. PE36]